VSAAWEAGRRGLVYLLVTAVGIAAFLYPFWLPTGTISTDAAHAGDAPLIAALVGLLALAAVGLEVRRGTMNGSTVALLGVLAASAGMLKLLDLPGGGNGMFFLLVLGGAAFGPRFGFLLGLASFAVGAVITGGIGPWLPFQMLTLAWMGAGAGFVGRATRRLPPLVEVVVVALYGWVWGFVFGAIMNLWFWPWFAGDGELAWHPGLGVGETLHHYWSFYVATSLAWDAAAASTNALVVLLVGRPVLRTLRRFAHRLDPVVELAPSVPPGAAPAQVGEDVVGVR
jgi:energy-coupling factor transport system substrate-specific component